MGSVQPRAFDVKRIAIVGAGPSGLAAAKYLRAQRSFETITVFEQQSEVGGVWNYNTVIPAPNPIPQTSPFYPPDKPVRVGQDNVFPSPMYDRLYANIPKSIMKFSDLDFPKDSWIFPSRHDIQDCLVKYSQDVRDLIKFGCQVRSIRLQPENSEDKWQLEAHTIINGRITHETFDAVVIANGHYYTPFVPDVRNIKEFHEAYPSIIIHSKNYDSVEAYRGKKTIVVGNGPSGQDIVYQINMVSRGQALLSVRHETAPEKLAHIGCREIAEIEEFLVRERGVRLKDGTVETEIDAVVFCTGYRYSLPFLDDLEKILITKGTYIRGLYKHLFCIEHPTIVFPTLNMKIVPWPFSETQMATVAAIWSNHLQLPPKQEMLQWSKKAEEEGGDKLHVMPYLKDGQYINELHDWAMTASRLGKVPPRWGGEEFWIRSIFGDAKTAFENGGCKATTLEELGFIYEPDVKGRKSP